MIKFALSFLLFCLALSLEIEAQEELIVVQAVSTSRQTFVINRGLRHGVNTSMEALFSTKDLSLMARVVEATRDFSMWRINEKRAVFPFEKEQIVTYNQAGTNIWNEIPEVREKLQQALTDAEVFRSIYGAQHSISARLGLTSTFYESVSETDSERKPSRGGFQVEAIYHYRWREKMELGAGLRFDKEDAVIDDPPLTIPSQRYFLLAEFTYHFDRFEKTQNNLYATVGAGIGRSQTTVNDSVSTGLATVLPYVKFGYLAQKSPKFAWFVESSIEAISTNESFLDTKEQTTNLVNAKIGGGLRF